MIVRNEIQSSSCLGGESSGVDERFFGDEGINCIGNVWSYGIGHDSDDFVRVGDGF